VRSLSIQVPRTERSSPLWAGRGLIEQVPSLVPVGDYSSVAVVADAGAHEACSRLFAALPQTCSRCLVLDGGERNKDINGLGRVWQFFVEQGLDRRSLVVTVGGGALSDLVGFAAATFMRGIALLHVPTTLLAQVDASIGGKTGVNFMGIKNLLGAVMQPAGVVIDIDALASLPPRELCSGFAEILKHGLIQDAPYFELTSSRPFSAWSPEELVEVVFRSCEIKRSVVEADETEQGPRKTLNFGHTIGHAVEGYALEHGIPLTHGEAVAIGMVGEALISWRSGRISEGEFLAVRAGIGRAGLPVSLPTPFPVAELRQLLARDKKNIGSQVRWVLLDGIGACSFDLSVPEALVVEALTAIQANCP